MKNLKTQIIVDRFLQGTLIAYALLAFVEMAIFAAVHSPLFCYPLVAFIAMAYVYNSAEKRINFYFRQIRLLQEMQIAQSLPMQAPPRHRNIRYVQKYEQKGRYAK